MEKFAINDKQVVLCISVDVAKDYSQVESVIKQAQEKLGPVDMLVNCAGTSLSGKFEEVEVDHFKKMMEVNYLGSVYPTRAVITTMKERRMGRIMFVSSQAGQIGLFGYTAYSPSKFALRGLAEALQMEMKPYNIYVTVAYPPDTDTPGFAEENKTKVSNLLFCLENSYYLTSNININMNRPFKSKFLCISFSWAASGNQVNFRDIWCLSTGASGKNCGERCGAGKFH